MTFAAYREAFEAKDVPRWLAFYAENATSIEYRHSHPPRAPNVMRGHGEIGAFLRRIAEMPIDLELSREVLSTQRIAFACTVELGEGGGSSSTSSPTCATG